MRRWTEAARALRAVMDTAAAMLTDPSGAVMPWEQQDSTNVYSKGDKVTHNGKTWISIIDNNSWEPGVYGWEEI